MNNFEKLATLLDRDVIKSGKWSQMWLKGHEEALGARKVTQPMKQHAWFHMGTMAVAENLGQVPFRFYNGEVSEEKEIKAGPVVDLFNWVNPFMDRFQLWEAIIVFLYEQGNCLLHVPETVGFKAGMKPKEFYPMGRVGWDYVLDEAELRIATWKYKNRMVSPNAVTHFKLFSPYELVWGMSKVTAAQVALDTDFKAAKYNENFFDNAAMLSGIVSTKETIGDEEQDKIKRAFRQEHVGWERGGNIAFVSGGELDYKSVSLSQKDMQFLEQRKQSREEILGMLGVPKGIVSVTDDLNYATLLGFIRIFWRHTVKPAGELIASKLNSDFFPRHFKGIVGAWDWKAVGEMQMDWEKKSEIAERLAKTGWPINKINGMLDLGFDDVPWGETWWIPFNLVPAEDVLEGGGGGLPPGGQEPKGIDIDKLLEPDSIKIEREIVRKAFLKAHESIERPFVGKLRRYFFEQRNRVLDHLFPEEKQAKLENAEVIFEFDWEEEQKRLKKVVMPYLTEATERGMELAGTFGISVDWDVTDPELMAVIVNRAAKITRITDTIKGQVRNQLARGLDEGETIIQLRDRVRSVFRMADKRALLIARTETTAAMNEGELVTFRKAQVEKKGWITAHDEEVRESHAENERQGPISVASAFQNGLMFPGGDGPAEEVCNCRCTIVPEFGR